MSKSVKVSASILCADFTSLADEIKKCESAGVDMIHVDVMDGHFVPNITIGPLIVQAIRPLTKLPIDVHLMVENPGMFIEPFAQAGADIISLHVECYGIRTDASRPADAFPKEITFLDGNAMRPDIQRIQKLGKKAFAVVSPGSPLCFDSLLNDIDGILVMSVNPGFAKQKFMPSVLPKIVELRGKFDKDVAIDGGINAVTAPEAVKAGANILATASYFFGASRPRDAVQALKKLEPVS